MDDFILGVLAGMVIATVVITAILLFTFAPVL
jgi:hypothetical protein